MIFCYGAIKSWLPSANHRILALYLAAARDDAHLLGSTYHDLETRSTVNGRARNFSGTRLPSKCPENFSAAEGPEEGE